MDSTYVVNQVNIPEIQTQIVNSPDSLFVTIVDPLEISQKDPVLICGMTQESAAIIIPTVATILVFVAGIVIDRIMKRIQGIYETQMYKRTVYDWIDCICVTTGNQVEKVSKLADDIAKNRTLQAVRFEFSKSMANKLDILTASKVLQNFVFNSTPLKGGNRTHAFNIVSQFDFLSSVENEIVKMYELYNQQSYALLEPWNVSIRAIGSMVGSIPDPSDLGLYFTLLDIYEKWAQAMSEDNDIDVDIILTKELFITPLSEYLGSHQEEQGSALYGTLVHHVNQLHIILKQWKALSSGYELNFRGYASSCTQSLKKLKDSKQALLKTYSYK